VGAGGEQSGGWTLTGRAAPGHEGATAWSPTNTLERVVVLGLTTAPASITIPASSGDDAQLSFVWDASTKVLTIRKPNVLIAKDFTFLFAATDAVVASS
jgi:hypothetical protein|tara:strand:+ start:939 stop:1235 length:297 start_codon:yes stop_codon:yes gene_type:complete